MTYLQHGRRHGQTGTDPIPPLGWALYDSGGLISVGAGAGQTYVDLNYSGGYLFTNDETGLFGLAAGTGSKNGFTVAEVGVYRVSWNFAITSATAGDHVEGYYVGDIGDRGFWMDGYSDLLFDSTTQQGSHISFSELMFVGGAANPSPTLPAGPEVAYVWNHTGNSFNVQVSVLVERIAKTYTRT